MEFLKRGPQASRISITRELVKNAESQALPSPTEYETPGVGTGGLSFNTPSKGFQSHSSVRTGTWGVNFGFGGQTSQQ